uniref:WH2 domain-containing protein n=1 Tax=Macrostomum lignano TaxID=282301 RepID=A0A1I8GLW0_9PLAT
GTDYTKYNGFKPQLSKAPLESANDADDGPKRARDPKFVTWRENRHQSLQGFQRNQEQQVDDVRCMFNLSSDKNVPRPVMQQDGGLMESTVAPHTADQLMVDLQQLGLVRAKGGPGKGDAGHDGRADREPILKDLKLV